MLRQKDQTDILFTAKIRLANWGYEQYELGMNKHSSPPPQKKQVKVDRGFQIPNKKL